MVIDEESQRIDAITLGKIYKFLRIDAILKKMEEADRMADLEMEQSEKNKMSVLKGMTRFNQFPKDVMDILMSDPLIPLVRDEFPSYKETGEKYQIDSELLSKVVPYVKYREISLGELPLAIEAKCKVSEKQALLAAIRISRHFLKQFSELHYIGNVDAYIKEWKDELEELEK